jgi:hypothetical protein
MNRRTHNIPERFLRHIWNKQYLISKLQVTDGRTLKVINVGQLNSDGGPDFCNARIKIDGVTYAGDVEIHRTVIEWLQHQHQEDPRYNKVVLHVVLETNADSPDTTAFSGRKIPVLVLDHFLSESIHTIWQKAILDERAMKAATIHCFHKNNTVNIDTMDRWLKKMAIERLELKLRRFDERLKQLAHERRMTIHEWQRPYGELLLEGEQNEIPPPLHELTQKDLSKKELWNQILYEGIMEGLGYSKNKEPFLKLAHSVTLNRIGDQRIQATDARLEALLFGAAGLIPKITAVKEKESRQYVRQLSNAWKALRSSFHSEILHAADWQFFPTRPSNFPTIRIAAACAIINKFLTGDLFRRIVQLLKSNKSAADKERELLQFFSIETNGFWKRHYNFDEAAPKSVTALGNMRVRDLIINAVLPVALLYARIFKDAAVREGTLDVYQSLPASEDNSIIRLMEKQLLKGRVKTNSANKQQAVIQLYKFYCTENRCSECELNASLIQ